MEEMAGVVAASEKQSAGEEPKFLPVSAYKVALSSTRESLEEPLYSLLLLPPSQPPPPPPISAITTLLYDSPFKIHWKSAYSSHSLYSQNHSGP